MKTQIILQHHELVNEASALIEAIGISHPELITRWPIADELNGLALMMRGALDQTVASPQPNPGLSCDDCGDVNLVDDTGNDNPRWWRCDCGTLHQPGQHPPRNTWQEALAAYPDPPDASQAQREEDE